MKATDQVKRAAFDKTFDLFLKNPEKNIHRIMDLLDNIAPNKLFPSQRKVFRDIIESEGNWYQLLMKIFDLNPAMRDRLIKTFVIDGNMLAWPVQEANREKYDCNIPWTVLLDPTSACNLHCTGCWAAEYGNQLNLTYDELDDIIKQSNELGTYVFIYTGGEPLVRKKDVIKLCEAHPDSTFLCFTNGTLIDDEFCQDMIRVANFIPAISVEGDEASTDSRRGDGTFSKVCEAMELLRKYKLPFGVSVCHTSENSDSITSEEFFDWMVDQGALFVWIFTYMPIGVSAPTNLMVTAEQRKQLYESVRAMRDTKPIFSLDFWNDGEYTAGCVAGGRRYLHINAAGDVEPCVFAHYANVNIHDTSLLEALQAPLFMAYHDEQPFNDNYLRPCPMLDNPGKLAEMVEATGAHSTNLEAPETATGLCDKCAPVAERWRPVADELWTNPDDPKHEDRKNPSQGLSISDKNKLERQGRRHFEE